jgi:hypothetical protein
MAWYFSHFHEGCSFCGITQQGFLQLLTNCCVFGEAAVSMADAWLPYDQICSHPGISFVEESAGLEDEWRKLTQQSTFSTNVWSDAYLAALVWFCGQLCDSYASLWLFVTEPGVEPRTIPWPA